MMSLSKHINYRSWVSLMVLLSFTVICITSVLMYTSQYNPTTALVHTVLGFVLLLIAFLHLKNNFVAIKQYFKVRPLRQGTNRNFALPIALMIVFSLVILNLFKVEPFLSIYEVGNTLRSNSQQDKKATLQYTVVDKILPSSAGPKLTIDLREGPYFAWPQYAFWVEDMQGNFIQPIFVTSKLAKNNFVNQVTKVDQDVVFNSHVFLSGEVDLQATFESGVYPETKDSRMRPESLPVFLHKLGNKTDEGVYVPAGQKVLADAYSGATITESFLLSSQLQQPLKMPFKVRLEINNSFDFNQFYSSDRFPDDPIYSGNGYSAQPSLIYEAVISDQSDMKLFPMKLIGRGHHSGQDGEIYKDLHNMTTALELIDRVIVELH